MSTPTSRLVAALAFPIALSPLAACMMPGGNAASHLAAPPAYDPPNQTKCSVKKSTDHPLIVEWPSADRATLEAKMQSGLVAVRYVGCEMEVLHRCKLTGKYGYTSITPKTETVSIKDADELYAKMPVGAAKLEGKLEKSGQLNVAMTIVGHYEADHTSFSDEQLGDGDCSRATHVVSGMTTGAFELSAGASASVGGEAIAFGAGAGGKSSASKETLERDGQPTKCEASSGRSEQQPDGCGAVLRLDVVPIEPPKRAKKPETVIDVANAGMGVEENGIAPMLNELGNVRVAVRCAESNEIVTPERGLELFLDGSDKSEKPLKTNSMTTMGTQMVNNRAVPVAIHNLTDVAYLLPPGAHKLRIATPDCAALESDIKISGTHAVNVEGDMEVTKPSLKGPVGAPWGGSWLIGGYFGSVPRQLGRGTNSEGSTYDIENGGSMAGGLLGVGLEHRYFAGALLYGVGFGSYSGSITSKGQTTPSSYSASPFDMMMEIRAGARIPLQYVALAGGAGIGGSLWILNAKVNDSNYSAGTPGDLTALWHIPLWAAADIKPFCNWGAQVTAQYNVQPTQFDGNYTMFGASLMWQPSPACERTAGINISP